MTLSKSAANKRVTVAQAAEIIDDAEKMHDPPPTVRAFDEREQTLWRYLMRARPYKEWTPTDLLLAARIVLLDTVIKRGEERLFAMIADGADILDPESYANEYNAEIIKVQRLQLTFVRAIGLTRTSVRNTETGTNSRASREREISDAMGMFGEHSEEGLLAFMAK